MPKTIRIRAGQIAADLAAQRLESEGVPARVVSDSDLLAVTGTPMAFSLLVPSQHEARARAILSELERT